MTSFIKGLAAAAALCLSQASAGAGPLVISNVASTRLMCTYDNACSPINDETVSPLHFTHYGSVGGLYTRTFIGKPDSWSGGRTGYLYRLDLTGSTFGECVRGVVIPVASIDKVNYSLSGLADIVVVNSGWLGSIGVASADYNAAEYRIDVYFERPVCPGSTTYSFGFSSTSGARNFVGIGLLPSGRPPLLKAEGRIP